MRDSRIRSGCHENASKYSLCHASSASIASSAKAVAARASSAWNLFSNPGAPTRRQLKECRSQVGETVLTSSKPSETAAMQSHADLARQNAAQISPVTLGATGGHVVANSRPSAPCLNAAFTVSITSRPLQSRSLEEKCSATRCSMNTSSAIPILQSPRQNFGSPNDSRGHRASPQPHVSKEFDATSNGERRLHPRQQHPQTYQGRRVPPQLHPLFSSGEALARDFGVPVKVVEAQDQPQQKCSDRVPSSFENGEKAPVLLGHRLSKVGTQAKPGILSKGSTDMWAKRENDTNVESIFQAMERLGHAARHRGQHVLVRSSQHGRKELIRYDITSPSNFGDGKRLQL